MVLIINSDDENKNEIVNLAAIIILILFNSIYGFITFSLILKDFSQ